jgi:hypothetical protein
MKVVDMVVEQMKLTEEKLAREEAEARGTGHPMANAFHDVMDLGEDFQEGAADMPANFFDLSGADDASMFPEIDRLPAEYFAEIDRMMDSGEISSEFGSGLVSQGPIAQAGYHGLEATISPWVFEYDEQAYRQLEEYEHEMDVLKKLEDAAQALGPLALLD